MSAVERRKAIEAQHRAAAIRRIAESTAAEQGLPPRLADPAIARRVAVLIDQPATPVEDSTPRKRGAA